MSRFIQDKSKIGQIIISGLQRKKKTIRQLSQDTGISYSYITKLIDGNIKKPSNKYIVNISENLDIPINDLINAVVSDEGASVNDMVISKRDT